jgi:hypothetical protein
MDVVGLQAFDGDERELLLDLLGAAMRASRLLLGGADEELEVFPAGGAMEVEERHGDASLDRRRRGRANPKDPTGIALRRSPDGPRLGRSP